MSQPHRVGPFGNALAIEVWGGALMFMSERLNNCIKWGADALEAEFELQFNRSRMWFEDNWNQAPEAQLAVRPVREPEGLGSIPDGSAANA